MAQLLFIIKFKRRKPNNVLTVQTQHWICISVTRSTNMTFEWTKCIRDWTFFQRTLFQFCKAEFVSIKLEMALEVKLVVLYYLNKHQLLHSFISYLITHCQYFIPQMLYKYEPCRILPNERTESRSIKKTKRANNVGQE